MQINAYDYSLHNYKKNSRYFIVNGYFIAANIDIFYLLNKKNDSFFNFASFFINFILKSDK